MKRRKFLLEAERYPWHKGSWWIAYLDWSPKFHTTRYINLYWFGWNISLTLNPIHASKRDIRKARSKS